MIIELVGIVCYYYLFQKQLKSCLFWQDNLRKLKLKRMDQDYFSHVLVYSDASYIAAADSVELNENVFHKGWTENKTVMSSTWRELKAIQLALLFFR